MTKKKIIVALDNGNLIHTKELINKLKNEAFAFKIGYEFFYNYGIEGYKAIQMEKVKIFLDLSMQN